MDVKRFFVQIMRFKYRWLKGYIKGSCFYHNQIGSIHLSHCFHIFPWLCAWDVCYIIFYHLLYIHSGKTGNLFSLVLCGFWWVQIVGYVLACRSYSFVCTLHHLIIIIVQTLSEEIELIECLSDMICRVWVRLSIFFQLFNIQYVGLCVFGLPISFMMIERIIIIKSEVWTIAHCLGLGHETMVCAVCLSILLWRYLFSFERDRHMQKYIHSKNSRTAHFTLSLTDSWKFILQIYCNSLIQSLFSLFR